MALKTLDKTESDELAYADRYAIRDKIVHHSLLAPDTRARLAFTFIERWGMISAMADGEDSSGRAKHRLATPEEIVARAFRIAELAWDEAVRRGMMLSVKTMAEIEKSDNEP